VRKLMSPTALVLTGAAVLAAAAAPAVTRAARRYFNAEEDRLYGIVQGGALSPLLCNLYLHEFDAALVRAGLHVVRYADDFVICCRDEAAARRAMELAAQQLAALRLRVHPQKTRIVRFDDGLEFLGYRFAQFENTATPISPKDTAPVVTVLQNVRQQAPAALREAKDKLAPKLTNLGERAAQQIKDKAARLGALVKKEGKGGGA
jgi:ribosomal protein L16/L10AE